MQDNNVKLTRTVQAINGEDTCAVVQSEPRKKADRDELSLQELSHKFLLTLEEANRYTGLGLQKLRELTNVTNCQMVLWNGNKRMFKRERLEQYLESQYSI